MKKLLVITGAGSSYDFGMPSNEDIDKLFTEKAKDRYPLSENPDESLYSYIKKNMKKYIDGHNFIEPAVMNFENVLFTIENLSALLVDQTPGEKQYHHRLSPFVEKILLPDHLFLGRQTQNTDGYDLSGLGSCLIDSLVKDMRERCINFSLGDKYHDKLNSLKNFFGALGEEFECGFINLNYDNVILTTCPGLETGFDPESNEFDRSRIYSSGWNFCYHLHGSVHFDMSGDTKRRMDMHKINWNPDLRSRFGSNSSGRSSQNTDEGLSHQTSCIIAGLGKTTKLLRDPFSCYYMQLDRLIYEADSILFIGYGFQDQHLNETISYIRRDSKVRKVVVITKEDDTQDGLGHSRHDSWVFGLGKAIVYDGFMMGDGVSTVPHSCGDYKNRNICEKSHDEKFPLAVWYGGLIDACNYPDVILKELV